MQYEDRILQLEQENAFLKAELRKRGYFYLSANEKLATIDKIEIYLSYFRGRPDVYAERYFSKKHQKFGWNPACDRSFQAGCKKGKIKNYCSICPISQFPSLDGVILKHHFTGKLTCEGIGIYPLLTDNTCYLLAMDFDEDNWFDDMLSVYKIALRYDIYPLMERSSSGQGGHLWLFFETAVKALKARKLGSLLIQEAMEGNRNLKFDSFDRMFPNQDYLPQGGFGNLIALPLRHDAYLKGNSSFINDLQQVIDHPIEYLASLPKLQEHQLDRILNSYYKNDYFFDQQQMGLSLDTNTKYSKQMYGLENTMLCIEKKELNLYTLSVLKRLGSMYNPEYFLKQKLKKPIYRETTPRVLSYYEEDDRYLYLPRGQKYKLQEIFPEAEIQIEAQVTNGQVIDTVFTGELRQNQQEAVNTLMQYDMGIMKAVPGFGKTVMALYMIAQRTVSTLVIVPNKEIQKQWEERIHEFLTIPPGKSKRDSYIGIYNGSKKKLRGHIDIAIAASLANLENIAVTLKEYGMIIIDECHHAANDTFTRVLRNVNAKYIYGFSATPKRKDGLEKVMHMFCGPIRYETSSFQIQNTYRFQQLLIPRMTTMRCLDDNKTYTQYCSDIMNDQVRNSLIVKDVVKEFQNDGKIIILSERRQHLTILYEMLKHLHIHVYVLTGERKTKERNEIIAKVRNFNSKEKFILLATSKLLGEGFDLPALSTLFLVMPISDESRIEQYTGRIHRNVEGKDMVKVYDYVDAHIPMLEGMFHKRLKQYQKEGYFLQEQNQIVEVSQLMYEGQSYKHVFLEDIKASSSEILIMNAHYELGKIKSYFDVLQEKAHQNVQLYVVLNDEQRQKEMLVRTIEGMGAAILYSNHSAHFVVIDKEIIWYSDMDFLGRAKKDGLSTRLKDPHLANEIMKIAQDEQLQNIENDKKISLW
ncbi:DEAD/DEAH box helicase family protein [[Clostridium] innocuum]|nr:DEAD/DEAH box helicase family protein [[Clostridium] innocuum]MCR0411713.1 DEAD/DEAH box helicase family protein [[Clostridium] innocuum]MCR0533114.1 DEAD/DEAH box helicase family protein [[Clostridium] innocuum]MCR0538119.1 DEAD/DEAH box helicase family protein [[Clostridium] innocuum]MDU1118272.1 DEAD/DEAH box helicase family protein [Erysipelotrichaceae bacterium]